MSILRCSLFGDKSIISYQNFNQVCILKVRSLMIINRQPIKKLISTLNLKDLITSYVSNYTTNIYVLIPIKMNRSFNLPECWTVCQGHGERLPNMGVNVCTTSLVWPYRKWD